MEADTTIEVGAEKDGSSRFIPALSTQKLFEADVKVLQRSQQEERGKPMCRHCKSFGGTISIGAAPTSRLCMVQGEICPGDLAASEVLYLYWHIQNRKVHGACCTVTRDTERRGRGQGACCLRCAVC